MQQASLDYRNRSTGGERPSRSVRNALFVIAAFLVLVALLLPTSIHVRQDLGWVDAISGSKKTQTEWRGGWSTTPIIAESPLAARYRKLGLQWTFDWRNVKGTYVDPFGRSVGSGHGLSPEIYSFAGHPELQEAWLAASSDDEVRELFRIMTAGSEAEQKIALEAAFEKALESPIPSELGN